ncbi:MAG: hypothetical protein GC166_00650 [Alphaproteobacteria bacterium]|nr:hypothetical protein [Alphaproteobacteria bacterium]
MEGLMTEDFALKLLLLAGGGVGGSLVLVAAAIFVNRFAKTAALRHLVWVTAFIAMLAVPVVAFIAPSPIVVHRQATIAMAEPVAAPATTLKDAAAVLPQNALPSRAQPSSAPVHVLNLADIASALFALWAMGAGFAGARLLFGAIGINALTMNSAPFARAGLEDFARRCELRMSGDNSGPVTWGFIRPVVLLPCDAAHWTNEKLRPVLLHELAHVRRLDCLSQLLAQLACTVYWPNPLVWLAARALSREAEVAADDAVIGAGVRPSDYAGALVAIAAQFRESRLASASLVPMARRSSLEARVTAILSPDQPRHGVRAMDAFKIAGLGFVATAALALACPSLADEAEPMAPPAIATPADVPAAPKAPAAVSAAELPAEPADIAALPEPPTPPEGVSDDSDVHFVRIERDGKPLTDAEKKKIQIVIRKAHDDARAALDKARPQVEQVMKDAHMAHLKAMRAMDEARPQIALAMKRARDAQPEIDKAMADARRALASVKMEEGVRKQVDEALRNAEQQLKLAMGNVHGPVVVTIEKHIDDKGNVIIHRTDSSDADPEADEPSED